MDDFFADTYKEKAKYIDSELEKSFNYNNGIYDNPELKKHDISFLQRRELPTVPQETKEVIQTDNQIKILNPCDRIARTASIWFQSNISRVDVEEILKCFETGIFIIRMDSQNANMVLSFKIEDKVAHVKIKINQKSGFFIDGSLRIFRSLNNLVYYYMLNPIREPDVKLKIPSILMESSHPNHLKFFENMKIDFWKTSVSQLKLSDIFLDSLIEHNFDPIRKMKKNYSSVLSLPDTIIQDKSQNLCSNKAGIIKNDDNSSNFFQRLKSKLFKYPTTKLRHPPISQERRNSPSDPNLPLKINHFNFISGLANDFDDYDYDG